MATTTLGAVYDQARSVLADDRRDGGQKYTNRKLLPHAQQAVRDLFRTLRNIGDPRINKEVYHVLEANTSMLAPSTAGITDMASPLLVEQRGGLTTLVVSAVTVSDANISVTTSAAHGFSTGDNITLNALGGLTGTEGLWAITKSSATVFVVNGCVASGTYGIGGAAVKSTQEFTEVPAQVRIQSTPSTGLGWTWRDNNMWFTPSSDERQLRISYDSSATVPTKKSDTIAVDDCLDFLATRAAALATKVRAPTVSKDLNFEALGRSLQPDASGGLLRALLSAAVKAEQRRDSEDRTRPPYRDPRPLPLW